MTTGAHDKHDHPIRRGDIVTGVYGGEHHTFVVESIEEDNGHFHVEGPSTVRLPATAVSRRKDLNPKDLKEGHVEHHSRQSITSQTLGGKHNDDSQPPRSEAEQQAWEEQQRIAHRGDAALHQKPADEPAGDDHHHAQTRKDK